MRYSKLAISALFSASLLAFGAAGNGAESPSLAEAASGYCSPMEGLNPLCSQNQEEAGWDGRWVESVAGRGVITITSRGRALYDVKITWPNGAAEHIVWEMTAGRDGAGYISYDDCRCTVIRYSADGSETETVKYTGGTGTFAMVEDDDHITWQDNMENAGRDSVFVRR